LRHFATDIIGCRRAIADITINYATFTPLH
jgi:hypothetical protein